MFVRRALLSAAVVAISILGGCEALPPPTSRALPAGVIAAVGQEAIVARTVSRIAIAQSITPRLALERAVSDALLASEAASRAGPAAVRRAERLASARVVLDELAQKAVAQGPASEEELEMLTSERWWQFDRPELRRAVHAVVKVQESGEDGAARELAVRIREAVLGTSTTAAFKKAAKGVPKGDLSVRVEALDPCALDGRVVDPAKAPAPGTVTGTYDPSFARALFDITAAGEVAGPFRTPFGYHVALLLERLPEHRVSVEERRRLLDPEAVARRQRRAHEALIDRLRAAIPVVHDRASVELTKQVRVAL